MKRIILTLALCLSAAGPSFAQNNMEAMRFLTVNALVQYGQKLYDRGDFNEACAVFNHVLTYDSHQAQALEYLKDMGHSPAPSPVPIVPVQSIIVIGKADEQIVNTVDVSDTESLKRAIEAQKRVIEKLRAQVMQMRANLAAQSAVE
jgi:hypothetical protein